MLPLQYRQKMAWIHSWPHPRHAPRGRKQTLHIRTPPLDGGMFRNATPALEVNPKSQANQSTIIYNTWTTHVCSDLSVGVQDDDGSAFAGCLFGVVDVGAMVC